jgi:hypothetical protein
VDAVTQSTWLLGSKARFYPQTGPSDHLIDAKSSRTWKVKENGG